MRTVTVYRYLTPEERVEIGRAWLMPSGVAAVSGFDPTVRAHYQNEGIMDFTQGDLVPIREGARFLDTLLADHQRTYVRAEESDE
jgi:hypothetical protein